MRCVDRKKAQKRSLGRYLLGVELITIEHGRCLIHL